MLDWTQLCQQLADRFQAVWDYSQRADFAIRLRYYDRNRTCVDIQTNRHILDMRPISFVCGSEPPDSTLRGLARATAKDWSLHSD
jgi:hypothetical protein